MSTSYTVLAGDTFTSIARKVYGDDQKSNKIREANPGATVPLTPGQTLVIPLDTDLAAIANKKSANTGNEVAISVGGRRFRFWTDVTIHRAIDTVDTVDFAAPFEPEDKFFRDTFRPFSFQPATIDVGGERLFTGTMVSPTPATSVDGRTVSASCYSTPGVLGDCTAPASAFPLEWDNVNLQTIAKKLAGLFGLDVVFGTDPGPVFERAGISPGQKVLAFLSSLASQRNLLISSTSDGKLLFSSAKTSGRAVADLSEGDSPLQEVLPTFSPQDYYSHVTGVTPVLIGFLKGEEYTVKNPRLSGVMRPYTFQSKDTTPADLSKSVESKASRMFANAVGYDVALSTWRDPDGRLWAPNTFITLQAPGAMVYRKSLFLIRAVTLSKQDNNESAVLSLVLPGALAGEVPETMPWDE